MEEEKKIKDDVIMRDLLELMPGLPRVLRNTVRRIEKFDFKRPTTLIERMQRDFDNLGPNLEGKEATVSRIQRWLLNAALGEGLKSVLAEVVRTLKRQTANDDPRYSLLLRLMNEADAHIPLISIFVYLRHGDPIEHLGSQYAPVDLLREAERTTGEERATAVLRALAEMEVLYRPYLITLWGLSFFRKGELPPEQIPVTGNLVKETHKRLQDFPGLVEPDAGWKRNSAVHNPRKYIISNDSLLMWDKNVPAVEVRVDDILAMVQRMYLISAHTIQRVAQLYYIRKILIGSGFLDAVLENIPDALSSDPARQKAADDHLNKKALEIIDPLRSYFDVQIAET